MQTNSEVNTPPQEGTERQIPQERAEKISVPEQKKVKGGKKLPLIILFILLGIIFLSAGVYGGYYFAKRQAEEQRAEQEEEVIEEEIEVEEEETEEEEEELVLSEFSGDYITAQLPEGWEIIEYEDGAGSDALMEMTDYYGLTGVSVLTDKGTEILNVYAVMGIGGMNLCSSVAQFSDTPQSYIGEINQRTSDFNAGASPQEPMPVVVQIGDAEYTEFNLVDYRGRRVGTDLYWNDLDNNNPNEFHPLCGLEAAVLSFDTLTFDYDSGFGVEEGNSYSVEIVGQPSEEDLLLLDAVMESMELI